MLLPETRPRPRRSVTASSLRVGQRQLGESAEGSRPRILSMPWQERALHYYDEIGELHYAASFYSKALSRIRLFPAYENPEDETLEPIESGPAVDLLERVHDPGGGRGVMLATYGQLMFITGEAYLLNTVVETDERWEVVSTSELKYDDASRVYRRRVAPSGEQIEYRAGAEDDFEPLDDEAIAYRLWRRHPRYSSWPDSPMRAILDIAEELVMLTLAVRARARSRLAQSGILYVAEEISPPPTQVIGDEDPLSDPFVQDLTEHFVTPIEDEGTAAAVVPFIVRGPANPAGTPAKDAIFHIKTHEPEETYPESGLRAEAIRRLALGLDMPPEALLGMSDSSHWTAWQVQETIWQSHLAPVCQQFCDDLTASYLRPAALRDGIDRADELVVAYDATAVIANPDRGKDANELYDRRAIGKKALREAKGFDDEDEPDEDELEEMLAVALRDPTLLAGLPAEGVAPAAPPSSNGGPPREEPESGPGPPPEGPPTDVEASARVLGAAELALHRCRELAGSRLRSKYRARPEMKVTDGSPNGLVVSLLGPVTLEQFGADALDLVKDGGSSFVALLDGWGYPRRQAEALGQMLEVYAARTLFEQCSPAAPAGLAAYLRKPRA